RRRVGQIAERLVPLAFGERPERGARLGPTGRAQGRERDGADRFVLIVERGTRDEGVARRDEGERRAPDPRGRLREERPSEVGERFVASELRECRVALVF